MARVLPVKERLYRTIDTKLEGITVANGYNTTIKAVSRRRVLPARPEAPPELFLVYGTSEYEEWGSSGGHSSIGVRVPLTVWFALSSEASAIDTECNFVEADVKKALSADDVGGTIYDNSNGTGSGRREGTLRLLNDQPQYSAVLDGMIVGRLEYELGYQHLKNDPYRWDENDTLVTE